MTFEKKKEVILSFFLIFIFFLNLFIKNFDYFYLLQEKHFLINFLTKYSLTLFFYLFFFYLIIINSNYFYINLFFLIFIFSLIINSVFILLLFLIPYFYFFRKEIYKLIKKYKNYIISIVLIFIFFNIIFGSLSVFNTNDWFLTQWSRSDYFVYYDWAIYSHLKKFNSFAGLLEGFGSLPSVSPLFDAPLIGLIFEYLNLPFLYQTKAFYFKLYNFSFFYFFLISIFLYFKIIIKIDSKNSIIMSFIILLSNDVIFSFFGNEHLIHSVYTLFLPCTLLLSHLFINTQNIKFIFYTLIICLLPDFLIGAHIESKVFFTFNCLIYIFFFLLFSPQHNSKKKVIYFGFFFIIHFLSYIKFFNFFLFAYLEGVYIYDFYPRGILWKSNYTIISSIFHIIKTTNVGEKFANITSGPNLYFTTYACSVAFFLLFIYLFQKKIKIELKYIYTLFCTCFVLILFTSSSENFINEIIKILNLRFNYFPRINLFIKFNLSILTLIILHNLVNEIKISKKHIFIFFLLNFLIFAIIYKQLEIWSKYNIVFFLLSILFSLMLLLVIYVIKKKNIKNKNCLLIINLLILLSVFYYKKDNNINHENFYDHTRPAHSTKLNLPILSDLNLYLALPSKFSEHLIIKKLTEEKNDQFLIDEVKKVLSKRKIDENDYMLLDKLVSLQNSSSNSNYANIQKLKDFKDVLSASYIINQYLKYINNYFQNDDKILYLIDSSIPYVNNYSSQTLFTLRNGVGYPVIPNKYVYNLYYQIFFEDYYNHFKKIENINFNNALKNLEVNYLVVINTKGEIKNKKIEKYGHFDIFKEINDPVFGPILIYKNKSKINNLIKNYKLEKEFFVKEKYNPVINNIYEKFTNNNLNDDKSYSYKLVKNDYSLKVNYSYNNNFIETEKLNCDNCLFKAPLAFNKNLIAFSNNKSYEIVNIDQGLIGIRIDKINGPLFIMRKYEPWNTYFIFFFLLAYAYSMIMFKKNRFLLKKNNLQ